MSEKFNIRCLLGKEMELNFPSGLCYRRSSGELFICDMQNQRVLIYNLAAKMATTLNRCRGEKTELRKPLAITLDVDDRLLLTDAIYNCIFLYEKDSFQEIRYQTDLTINIPGSIVSDSKGNTYISDFLNNRILKLDNKSQLNVMDDIRGEKMYGLCIYNDILYITDNGNGRILWYDTISGSQGALIEDISDPIAITADEDGDIYVSENRNIYLHQSKTGSTKLLLIKEIWKNYGLERLGHIGAMVSVSRECLLFSDTVKNRVYEINNIKSGV